MTLVVHHYFPLGSENLGDHLVARALRAALARHFGPLRFVDMPVNDRYRAADRPVGLRGENLERTNAEADLVLIGGSNLLEPRRHGGWGVFTDGASIARLRPPLLLLGMGTGSDFGRSIRRYREPGRSEVQALHRRAFAAAVRDEETVRRLAAIGVATTCVGCPVTFTTDRPVTAAADGPLLVALPPPRIARHWGGRAFLRGAMQYVRELHDRGVALVVTLHDTRDAAAARELVPPGVKVFAPTDAEDLVRRFERARGVIGFRLHAALLGLGLGKPVVPVSVDWRGRAFVETFGLDALAIRPRRWGQFRKLHRLTERLLAGDAELIGPLAAAKARYLARYEAFLAEAARRFAEQPRAKPQMDADEHG